MGMINVYSRSPISHQFKYVEGEEEKVQVIKGMNCIEVMTLDKTIPKVTLIEEAIFEQIKKSYANHVKLFGGKIDGIKYDAQIYSSKSDEDAKKKMNDSKPVITDNEIASKTKNIQPLV